MIHNIARVKSIAIGVAWASLMMSVSIVCAGEASVADLVANLSSKDEAARIKAIDAIGSEGAKAAEAVQPLAALLKDDSAIVRAHAVTALGAIGAAAKAAVPEIVDLLKDPSPVVRRQILVAIRAIRPGPKVTVPLCVKLLEESDPTIRARVLNAIADAGPAALPGLLEALKHEKATYWSLLVLREIGPGAKDAVPAVVEVLKDARPEIRREAVLTLGALNDASTAPQIAPWLSDEHVRTAATFVLGQFGQLPGDADATCRANAKSDDKLLSTVSLWALARVHPDDKELRREATEQLIGRLKEKDQFVRVAAARALAALPPAPEITGPIWEKALQNADEATLSHAVDALATLGAPAVPRLIEGLKHPKLRATMAAILGRIGPAAAPATDALAQLVEDKDAHVAEESIMALGAIGPGAKDAVPALAKALQGADKDGLDVEVALALGRIGPEATAAVPALVKLLDSSNADLAVMSGWALSQIVPASSEAAGKAVPVLVKGLECSTGQDRHIAAEALGCFGALAKDATAALEKASTDADPGVSAAAKKALAAVH